VNELSIIDFFDPRGRVDRKGFLIFAAVLTGTQAGLYGALYANGGSFHSSLSGVINVALFWMGYAGISKRLHDLDYSAWRLSAAIAGMMLWCFALSLALVLTLGEAGFEAGAAGWIAAAIGTLLPLAVLVLWIHCAKGAAGANRYGARPGPSGFARPPPARCAAPVLATG
jgi:uncharacterized membrane protein YhaH (DUF805 family)